MSKRLARLTTAISVAAHDAEIHLHYVRLRDFMDSVASKPDAPADELCAAMLLYFCVDEGCWNREYWPVIAALRFMEKEKGCTLSESEMAQAYKDVKRILRESPTSTALSGWAKSHFA